MLISGPYNDVPTTGALGKEVVIYYSGLPHAIRPVITIAVNEL